MAFCQYHLSHELPVVGIPHFHHGYSIDNSIVKSQNFVCANLKCTFQGQKFSPLCGVARPLFKYSATKFKYSSVSRHISSIFQTESNPELTWLSWDNTCLQLCVSDMPWASLQCRLAFSFKACLRMKNPCCVTFLWQSEKWNCTSDADYTICSGAGAFKPYGAGTSDRYLQSSTAAMFTRLYNPLYLSPTQALA